MEVTELSGANPQMELIALFRPGIDTPFPPTIFNDLEMGEGESSKNLLVLEEQNDKENSPSTTPVFARLTDPHRLLTSHPFRTRNENLPQSVYRTLFE